MIQLEKMAAWINHVILLITPESVAFFVVAFARQCAPVDVGTIFQLPANIVGLGGTLAARKIYQRQLASVDLQQQGSKGRSGGISVTLVTGGVWGRGSGEGKGEGGLLELNRISIKIFQQQLVSGDLQQHGVSDFWGLGGRGGGWGGK